MPKKNHYARYRFLARVHFWVLGFSLFGYLALAFTLGPGFLAFDVSQKIRALADEIIVVTATVLGPPASPVVTATASCVSGAPRITLDWADDAATSSWDVERDSAPLVSGLTSSGYVDTAVSGTASYTYVVTALGPMSPGIATSVSVVGTAIDCSTLLPAATLTLTQLGSKNITPPRTLPIKINESRPRIKGNTNVANAIVDIQLTRPVITAQIQANANGYFTWRPPRTLHVGHHALTVTVTDPNDSSRTATETIEFSTRSIVTEEEETAIVIVPPSSPATDSLFDFTVTLDDMSKQIIQGKRLEFTVKPVRGLFPSGTVFAAILVDKQGEVVFTAPTVTIAPDARPGFHWSMETPVYLPEGEYHLQVEAFAREVSVTRSASFVIKAQPLIRLGDRGIITQADIASFIGWIFFSLLCILVFFFLFFLREYWLYLHSVRHITERELSRFGMIPLRRKEVEHQ